MIVGGLKIAYAKKDVQNLGKTLSAEIVDEESDRAQVRYSVPPYLQPTESPVS